jgi:hypothetical protein
MSNKTISINPSLFSIGGASKSRKNRDKNNKPHVAPLISPNLLKNKLLKRIKEHKMRETENLENNKKKLPPVKSEILNTNTPNDTLTYTDEFNDTISYLQTLSKQKKINDEKEKYQLNKEKKLAELERMTVKNYKSIMGDNNGSPYVNIDLPEELQQPLLTVNTELLNRGDYNQPITLLNRKPEQVPYGILKGGTKPTYRDWNRSQKNLVVTNPESSLIIQGGMNKQTIERENRLNALREKLKNKQIQDEINGTQEKMNDLMLTQNLIQPRIQENEKIHMSRVVYQPETHTSQQPQPNNNPNSNANSNALPLQNVEPTKTKIITKRTIKRKYTLGKSQIKKSVAVLLKDRGTRKRVLMAQRDLKRKSINDVKAYLREHNLIKIGSNAPNDVIRKLYESTMLAGEITNKNTDILLHNLTKQDTEG